MRYFVCIIILLLVTLHAVYSFAGSTSDYEAMDIKVTALRNGVSHSGERLSTGFSNTIIIKTPGGMMELKELR